MISYHAGTWHCRIFADLFSQIKMAAKDGKTARVGWHWSCGSTYCKHPWKTPNVEYYTLTEGGSAPKTAQDAYLEVLG